MIFGLIAPIEQYWGGGIAMAAPCTNDKNWEIGQSGEAKRCINGYEYTTRRRLKKAPGCLQAGPPGLVLRRSSCGQGVEAIGQARAVKYLSDRLETPSLGTISPNVQWEMQLPDSKRPDIVVYDRTNAGAGVDVYEAKTTENKDYADWSTQVDGYIQHFRGQGMTGVRRGTVLNRWGTYRDEFQVWDSKETCKTSAGESGFTRRTYVATSPQAGLLHIEEEPDKAVCDKDRVQPPAPPITQPSSQPTASPSSTPTAEPTTPPVPPVPVPVPAELLQKIEVLVRDGVPQNVLAAGGATVVAATLISELEAWLGTAAGAAFLAEVGLTAPAALALGGVALATLILWYVLDHYGAHANGDPHIATVDGLNYDLQSAGEFLLAESERYGFTIQGRFTPLWADSNVSTVSRVAMDVNEHRVEFDNNGFTLDGSPYTLQSGKLLSLGEGTFVTRDSSNRYLVTWQGVGGPVFAWSYGKASLWVPPSADSDLVGLFGNADGNPANDLRYANGTQLPANASATLLHSDYADSWRVTGESSLFTYGPGQSTATFTDLTFPRSIVTWHDLAPDQIALASAQCEAAGVPAGPAFNGCVLDLALTADTRFATSAAQRKTVGTDPQARGVNASGDLATDFEGSSLPPNLSPARLATDPGTTSFAGPFTSTESYRSYVQGLPPHLGGTLAFDLLAIGDWTSGTEAKTITTRVDRGSPTVTVPSNLTPTATGTLSGNVPYARYRVTVPFTHGSSQAEFTVAATGISGIGGQAFGIDNLALHIEAVPAQSFTTTLPLTVSDGVPGPGAGNLENAAAQDEYRFDLPAGSAVYVRPTACPSGNANLRWSLLTPGGATAGSGYGCQGGEVRGLAAGTHRLAVTAQNDAAGPYALKVTAIPADTTATAATDGTASRLTVNAPGQNGGWSFQGTAGQRVYLDLSDGTLGDFDAQVSVLKPDGSTLLASQYCGTSCGFDTATLPVDGAYTVRYDPRAASTGSLTARIFTVTDVTTTISADGTASRQTTTVPGQKAVWTFNGTAGQRVSVGLSDGTITDIAARASLLKPDGSVLSTSYCAPACVFDTAALPTTGVYKLVFAPEGNRVGSLTAKLWTVPTDVTAALPLDGTSSALTTTVPGQNGVWTFAGTAGQRVAFGFSGGTLDSLKVQVSVLKPDGSVLHAPRYCGPTCTIATTSLPADGTYRILFDPLGTAVGSMTASVSADVMRQLVTDGTASTLTTTAPGQNGAWTFTGTTGQRVYIDLSGGTFTSTKAEVSVLKPDGSTFLASQYCGTSCGFDTTALPADGTYTVALRASGGVAGSLTAKAWTVPADVTAALPLNGTTSRLTTVTPGQNGVWTFAGTAGQQVAFGFSGGTLDSLKVQVSVLKPDGSVLHTPRYCGPTCTIATTSLPADGTYRILFDPLGTAVGSMTASVSADIVRQLVTDGTASTLTTTAPGQNGAWTFTGTTGQRIYIDLSGGTLGDFNAQVSVLKPDGSTLLASQYCGTSCGFDTTALPADGTYTIALRASGGTAGTLTAKAWTVPADPTNTVTPDGTANRVTTATPGQNGRWSFSGTTGQRVFIDLSAGTLDSLKARAYVLKPDGSVWRSGQYCGDACFYDTLALPVDGTYTVVFDPQGSAVGSLTAKVWFVPADATVPLATDGTAAALNTVVPGQNGVWTFSAGAGQKAAFTFSAGVGGGSYGARVSVLKPDGSVLLSPQYCGTSCTFGATTLPSAGRYTVLFDPQGAATGSLTAKLALTG
ncbi:pre-peptidase C-terminal domain-containing protein [Kitasatospora sp. NPDC057965]|uniref:pre-peptidase C-terminal domain-containing protein n=1 Tax=Kitasatospora sp. NPDC057965 TaxID=3346291 RepID=UPI0036D7B22A